MKMHRPISTLERDNYLANASQYARRGNQLTHAKLCPEKVKQIRDAVAKRDDLKQYIREELSNDALAKKLGVHVRTIERVTQNTAWFHIKYTPNI